MGWSYRRSHKIGPVRINESFSGIGASIGAFGFRTGITANGRRYSTFSIPGTGLRYTFPASAHATIDEVLGLAFLVFLGASVLMGLVLLFFLVVAGFVIPYRKAPQVKVASANASAPKQQPHENNATVVPQSRFAKDTDFERMTYSVEKLSDAGRSSADVTIHKTPFGEYKMRIECSDFGTQGGRVQLPGESIADTWERPWVDVQWAGGEVISVTWDNVKIRPTASQ